MVNENLLKIYGMESTGTDMEGCFSLVLYTKTCSLACHGCHNRRNLGGWDYKDSSYRRNNIVSVDNTFIEEINLDIIETEIKSGLYDYVILCGGEVTIQPLEKIINTINYIKELNSNIKIRIDTNSIFPEKMKDLNDLVDGFACDIKFPYIMIGLNDTIDKLAEEILGLPIEILRKNVIPKMIEGLKVASKNENTIYRTVKYPLEEIIKNINYTENELKIINKFIKNYFNYIQNYINSDLGGKKYYLNDFAYL